MKLTHNPDASVEFQYRVEPHSPGLKAAVDAIRSWPRMAELASLALSRHGYSSTDSYCGITYPTDLDEMDRTHRESIPRGFIEAYAGYGDPNVEAHLVSESEYLELLRQFLIINGLQDDANRIKKPLE
ncbi:hypothetical protein OAG68_00960 [bacterium]|nr:hypothetical protein [bacterium]